MYYPDQRFVSNLTIVNRECLMPEDAIGRVQVVDGTPVDIRDTVAQYYIPGRHIIIEAAETLGNQAYDDEKLREMMKVDLRTAVMPGDELATRGRGRRVVSPVAGVVMLASEGRIIVQETPEYVKLQAGVRGDVVRVYENRGVAIEATGALIQGVWGNGGNVIAALRMEPVGGVNTLSPDDIDTDYKNQIVVTTRPISANAFTIAEGRSFAGIIAPSMDANLIEQALAAEFAVILTEGFGEIRMSDVVLNILREFDGYQAALDAYQPQHLEPRRPEVVINRQADSKPDAPNLRLALRKGMRVRVTREPYIGQVGKIVSLPERLQLLDNGLRVKCAEIDISFAGTVYVPLVNLELVGT